MTHRFGLIQSYLHQTQLILIFLNRPSGRIRVGCGWYVSDCINNLFWNFNSYRSPALKIVENLSRLPPERTSKRTHEANGEHVLIGSCCVQGFRATMEDEVIIEASLPSPLQSWSIAAVLDGHGGDLGKVLKFWRQKVSQKIFENHKKSRKW